MKNRHDDVSASLISHRTALGLGLAGVAGAAVLIYGDMLFYFNGSSRDFVATMASISPDRIVASAICALVSAWLYTLGAGQVYYGLQPARRWLRLTVFFSFLAVMIAFGVVHGAYVAIATSAQNAAELGGSPHEAAVLAKEANSALRDLAYVPFGIFTVFFTFAVWTKQSHYPRWFLLFSPVLPFLLADPITSCLSGTVRAVVTGAYLNLILLVFFAVSTLALWKRSETEH